MILELESMYPELKNNSSFNFIKARAKLNKLVRSFFDKKQVIEVETPLLGLTSVTSPYIQSLEVLDNNKKYYLQTSPEYAMKRLLCLNNNQSIYQICKAFRKEEIGSMHHIEFSMLEWYRLDFSIFDLMNEIEELINLLVLDFKKYNKKLELFKNIKKYSYQEVFLKYLNLDPLEISYNDLLINFKKLIIFNNNEIYSSLSFDDMLQQLFCKYIEPKLDYAFVYNFPKSQAALAKINLEDKRVANRFELYLNKIEIANGYDELLDSELYKKRFEQENQIRKSEGIKEMNIDNLLLDALKNSNGLPDCSGVALGLDRLLMFLTDINNIEQIISFRF